MSLRHLPTDQLMVWGVGIALSRRAQVGDGKSHRVRQRNSVVSVTAPQDQALLAHPDTCIGVFVYCVQVAAENIGHSIKKATLYRASILARSLRILVISSPEGAQFASHVLQ